MEMGQVPDIEGIYRDDLLGMAGSKAGSPTIDTVLVSHAHADHIRYISFLHREIPLYTGSTCHTILRAIQDRAPRATLSARFSTSSQSRQREEPGRLKGRLTSSGRAATISVFLTRKCLQNLLPSCQN
jgi:glyoxylase-like metal-dependent hydrolase (beta-lactamase superfamily II)